MLGWLIYLLPNVIDVLLNDVLDDLLVV